MTPIDETNRREFHDYCWLFADKLDQSFFPLSEDFEIKETRPGFLMYDDEELIGASSLILDESFTVQAKGRFVLLHSRKKSVEIYRRLLEALLPFAETAGAKKNFLFLPSADFTEKEILLALGFKESRKTFFLEKKNVSPNKVKFPELTIVMKPFKPAEDTAIWCEIINIAYKDVPGHIPYTHQMVKEDIETDSTFPGCAQICYCNGKPIGLFYCSLEAEDELWISQLAVLPEFRRKGVGRFLLKTCMNMAADYRAGCGFTVNSENTPGLKLFLSEGFIIRDEYTAFCYYLK